MFCRFFLGWRSPRLSAETKIDAVTIIRRRIVTRVGALDLPDGDSTVLFSGLPMNLDPASLRIEAAGDTRVEIAGLESSVQTADPKQTADAFTAKLAALNDEREKLGVTIAALQGERAMIEKFGQSGPDKLGGDGKALAIADWEGAWRAIHDGLAKVDADLAPAKARLAAIEAQIAALNGDQNAAAQGTKRQASVALLARGAGHATFKLSYRIAGVGWTPAYDAALDTSAANRGDIHLTRRALVAQQSGEDWRDVALTVSTARVAQATDAVALDTSHVDFWNGVAADAARPASVAEAAKRRAPAPPQGAGTAAKTEPRALGRNRRADEFERLFRELPRPRPGDGAGGRLATLDRAADEQPKANLILKTAPAFDPAVYLEAKFANEGDAPILPGQVSILRDGAFIGLGALDFVAPGDTITLGFGADDRVKVQRAPVSRKENDPVWYNQSRVATLEFKTSVKNLHDFPVSVQLVDQMPVSQNTAIVGRPRRADDAAERQAGQRQARRARLERRPRAGRKQRHPLRLPAEMAGRSRAEL